MKCFSIAYAVVLALAFFVLAWVAVPRNADASQPGLQGATISVPAFLTGPVLAKRGAPNIAKPVISGGLEYRVVHDRYKENGRPRGIRAFVEARDEKSKQSFWRVEVYHIRYRLNLETDVQDIYISTLKIDASGLSAIDERGQTYIVDLKTRTVEKVQKGSK